MPLAKALKRMGTDKLMLRRSLACAVVAIGLSVVPAWSECLSPSAEAGATTTTVYPCQEESAAGGQQPIIVDTGKADSGKSTVVERGSADIPWFEPKPTATADPIGLPKTASENEKKEEPAQPKEEIVKIEPVPMEAPEKAEAEPTDVKVKAKAVEPEATEAEPAPAEAKPARTKVTKAKSAKTKVAKAKRTKVKLAKTKRTKAKLAQDKPTKTVKAESVEPQPEPAKTKRTKAKLVQDKRAKTKTVKAESAEPKPEPAKTEPATDSNVIVMTKKDMSLGNRVKNWFGF